MSENSSKPSSICLVRLWYGKYPPYLGCVLRSCASNPDIHWLVISDNAAPQGAPANVRFHHMTPEELRQRFTEKLGFEPAPPELNTDLKAALGLVFEELLVGYDFWGQCDFDVIFGDLRKFLHEDILAVHDKILCCGHLTLYRNTTKINRAFMLDCPGALDYRNVFKTVGTTQFDEMRGVNLIFRYHNIPQFRGNFIIDIIAPLRYTVTRFEGTALQNQPQQVFYWYQGKVFHSYLNRDHDLIDDEYAYLHFQKRQLPTPEFNPFTTDGFLITPDGFFPYNREPLSTADFERYNRERWRPLSQILPAFWLMIVRGMRRRLGLTPQNDAS